MTVSPTARHDSHLPADYVHGLPVGGAGAALRQCRSQTAPGGGHGGGFCMVLVVQQMHMGKPGDAHVECSPFSHETALPGAAAASPMSQTVAATLTLQPRSRGDHNPRCSGRSCWLIVHICCMDHGAPRNPRRRAPGRRLRDRVRDWQRAVPSVCRRAPCSARLWSTEHYSLVRNKGARSVSRD